MRTGSKISTQVTINQGCTVDSDSNGLHKIGEDKALTTYFKDN